MIKKQEDSQIIKKHEDHQFGLPQDSIEELRNEFMTLGGVVDKLPEVSSVRDFTIVVIPKRDISGVEKIELWFMVLGKWWSLNDYYTTPVNNSASIVQKDTHSEVNIVSANIEYEIISANIVGGADDWSLAHKTGIAYNDGVFTVGRAGRYFGIWSLSISSASANQDIEAGFWVDGSPTEFGGWAHRKISTASDVGSFSNHGITELRKGAKVSMAIMNETSTANVFIEHAGFTIFRVR